MIDHTGGRFQVVWLEPSWSHALPPAGATVQFCDGNWIGTYLQNRVAPSQTQVPDVQARDRVQAEAKPVGIIALGADLHRVGMPNFNGGTSMPA